MVHVVEASAPASSANLGPGYDCLAVALDMRCMVRASPSSSWEVIHEGPESPEVGAGDLIRQAAVAAVGRTTPLRLVVENHIPIGKGLGSSAAALAAAATAAWAALDGPPPAEAVFRLVADLEGHADNAAACIYGGLALVTPAGHRARLPWHESWRVVVAVPETPLATQTARLAVPRQVPMAVTVRTLARAMALAVGLSTGDEAILTEAGGDELHERPRSPLVPQARLLIEAARAAGAAHACWSGAGPSVLAVVAADRFTAVVDAMRNALGTGRIVTPEVDRRGVSGIASLAGDRPS